MADRGGGAAGARFLGTGERTLTPTVFVGKGFGSLPDSMKFFRPFAVTAQVGYSIPTESSTTEFDAVS